MILKELLWADGEAKLSSKFVLECKFGAKPAVPAGVSRYPNLCRPRLGYKPTQGFKLMLWLKGQNLSKQNFTGLGIFQERCPVRIAWCHRCIWEGSAPKVVLPQVLYRLPHRSFCIDGSKFGWRQHCWKMSVGADPHGKIPCFWSFF